MLCICSLVTYFCQWSIIVTNGLLLLPTLFCVMCLCLSLLVSPCGSVCLLPIFGIFVPFLPLEFGHLFWPIWLSSPVLVSKFWDSSRCKFQSRPISQESWTMKESLNWYVSSRENVCRPYDIGSLWSEAKVIVQQYPLWYFWWSIDSIPGHPLPIENRLSLWKNIYVHYRHKQGEYQ